MEWYSVTLEIGFAGIQRESVLCMEWAHTRLIKGMVLEEKQRCVMNNFVEGWYLLFFNNMGLQLMTLEWIAIISIIISILP